MNRKLWIKILLPVSIIVCMIIGGIIVYNVTFQEKNRMEQLAAANQSMIRMVNGFMFDALSIGENNQVRAQFDRIGRSLQDVKIFVYDYNGVVSFSTDAESIGQSMETYVDPAGLDRLDSMLETGQAPEETSQASMNGSGFLYNSQAIFNESKCHHCHGDTRKILGGISVFSGSDTLVENLRQDRIINLMTGMAGLVFIVLFIWLFFHFIVNTRVKQILDAMALMRQGDFTNAMEVGKGDELNHILARISFVNQELRSTLDQVKQNSTRLFTAASDLTSIAGNLSSTSVESAGKASAVTTAAEKMSSDNTAISSEMSQASESVQAMAAAIEQLSATVLEITQSVNSSKTLTQDVVEQFSQVIKVVENLHESAGDLDEVTDEIRSISEQVGMLALNAKIEAARAGEAGKGFGVVAQEISALALDTDEATVQADEKLQRMREMTGQAISSIEQLSQLIQSSDDAMASISAAVEEQNATTKEISQNVSSVSEEMTRMNTQIQEGAVVAGKIAGDIESVEHDSHTVKDNSQKVDQAADSLSSLAESLEKLLQRFKI